VIVIIKDRQMTVFLTVNRRTSYQIYPSQVAHIPNKLHLAGKDQPYSNVEAELVEDSVVA
jgi:hypothetical protein